MPGFATKDVRNAYGSIGLEAAGNALVAAVTGGNPGAVAASTAAGDFASIATRQWAQSVARSLTSDSTAQKVLANALSNSIAAAAGGAVGAASGGKNSSLTALNGAASASAIQQFNEAAEKDEKELNAGLGNAAGVTTKVYKKGSPEDPFASYTANPGYGGSDNSDPGAGAQHVFENNVYGNGADETVQAVNGRKPQQDSTESPALKDSPYNPDVVNNRVKPPYQSNAAHDIGSPLYNPRKSPEPSDAQSVYENNAIRGGDGIRSQKTWYGKGQEEYYQFFSDNAGTVHFSGVLKRNDVPNTTRKIIDRIK